ncbi:MAG: hypothetical protein HKN36_13265 [Hellea sp.]|nr:hypothetical protein [Hellea sp.]
MTTRFRRFSAAFITAFLCQSPSVFAENIDVKDYDKTFDNIPADWEQFYLSGEQIEAGKGDKVPKVYMTKHTFGQSGDATLLAGGHWFTVIGKKHILIKDENEQIFLIETQGKCRSFKRLKHIYLGNNSASIYYKKNGAVIGLTRFNIGTTAGSPYGGCEIDNLYKWAGPTYYLPNIKRPVRSFNIPKIRGDRSGPLSSRVGR